jgi:hypothetical protein
VNPLLPFVNIDKTNTENEERSSPHPAKVPIEGAVLFKLYRMLLIDKSNKQSAQQKINKRNLNNND